MNRFEQVEGFVLTGGASTRMGRDKALLEIAGVPMLLRIAHLLGPMLARVALVGSPGRYAALGLPVFADDWPDVGPLGGLASALRHSESEWNLIVACDLPGLTEEWIEWLIGRALTSQADALVPESAKGLEPLCAVYRSRGAAVLATAVERGVRKTADAVGLLAPEKIPESEWKRFDMDGLLLRNMNSPEDYAEIEARYRGGEIG